MFLFRRMFLAWIGNDFPTWWNVDWSPVEMEFGETVNYPLDGELGDRQWNSMRSRNYQGYIRLGPEHRLMAVDMFHQLHCVNTFRKALIRPHDVDANEHHILHCLHYLRQLFLCAADTTLEPYDFLAVNYTLQGPTRFVRQCRDWSVLYKGLDDNAAEWAAFAEDYNSKVGNVAIMSNFLD